MAHNIFIGLLLALIGWRIYARLRRNIGRQPFHPGRIKAYVAIFSILSLIFAFRAADHSPLMLGWLTGVVAGALLGAWGLRLTRFETTAEGRFYTPNGHIGVALSLLFVARLAYRMIAIYSYSHLSRAGTPPKAVGESALTYLVFELLASYSIVYYSGALRRKNP